MGMVNHWTPSTSASCAWCGSTQCSSFGYHNKCLCVLLVKAQARRDELPEQLAGLERRAELTEV